MEDIWRTLKINNVHKTLAALVANRSGLLNIYGLLRRKLSKSHTAILMYHRVAPKQDNWSLEPLSPRSFERQIEYLCRTFELLSLDQLVHYIRGGESFPEKAAVITFDDGYKDDYLYAYPILKKHHVPTTIFLTAGHIGTDRLFWWDKVSYIVQHTSVSHLNLDDVSNYHLESVADKSRISSMIAERLTQLPEEKKSLLIDKLIAVCQVEIPPDLSKELILSWDEVREMDSNGISFGAHSVTHPILTNMPLKQAQAEIIQSKRAIEERLSREVTAFAYPNGDFNAEIVELVIKSGFVCAVSVLPGKLVSPKDSPYKLSRLGTSEDFNKFKVALCGLWGDLKTAFVYRGRGGC